VRLSILTRKSLGGIETDLSARVLRADGQPLPGLYAAGEVTGFGGGGVHGYRALEGTFLGGCLFSGRTATFTISTGQISYKTWISQLCYFAESVLTLAQSRFLP
jgi:predicted oxidoreductase